MNLKSWGTNKQVLRRSRLSLMSAAISRHCLNRRGTYNAKRVPNKRPLSALQFDEPKTEKSSVAERQLAASAILIGNGANVVMLAVRY